MIEHPIFFKEALVKAILHDQKSQTRRIIVPGKSQQEWLDDATLQRVLRWANTPGTPWWTMAVGADGEPAWSERFKMMVDPGHIGSVRCPYGMVGDRLYVRETFWRHDGWKGSFDPGGTLIILPNFDGKTHTRAVKGDLVGRTLVTDMANDPWRLLGSDKAVRELGWVKKPMIHHPRWACRLVLEIVEVRVQRLTALSDMDALDEGLAVTARPTPGLDVTIDGEWWPGRPQRHFRELWEGIEGPGSWERNPYVWAITFKRLAGAEQEEA